MNDDLKSHELRISTFMEKSKEELIEILINYENVINEPENYHLQKDAKEIYQLKQCLNEILFMAVANSNGGYYSDFGVCLLKRMVELTGFDMKKRNICLQK
jgi:hypothetical protein